MKHYPLEIQKLTEIDAGSFMGYYSKGHHDFDAFVSGVEHESGEIILSQDCRHLYWRIIPYSAFEFQPMIWDSRPGRGAFPVTVWEQPLGWTRQFK